MLKKIRTLFIICSLCLMVTACGPSEEKVLEAQKKYSQLIETNNKVVEAHNNVNDDSMYEQLVALQGKIADVEAYNLNDMQDEEIDMLIEIMDTLIASYEEFYTALQNVKVEEEAAVLIPIPITVINNSGKEIISVKLYQEDETGVPQNVLEGLTPLENGQTMTGLMIQRDVNNTPWLFVIEETEGAKYEFVLPVETYDESGKLLTLVYDEEASAVILAEEPKESETENSETADGEGSAESTEEAADVKEETEEKAAEQ